MKTDTRGWVVSGAAYGKKLLATCLTHAVDWDAGRVLCGRVKFESMLDDECITTDEPTCRKCAAALKREGSR